MLENFQNYNACPIFGIGCQQFGQYYQYSSKGLALKVYNARRVELHVKSKSEDLDSRGGFELFIYSN